MNYTELHLGNYYYYSIDEEIYNKIIQIRSFGQIPIIHMERSNEYYIMIGNYNDKMITLYFSKIIYGINQFPILQNASTKILSFDNDIKPHIICENYNKDKEETDIKINEKSNMRTNYRIQLDDKGFLDIKKELYNKILETYKNKKSALNVIPYIEMGKDTYCLNITRSGKNIRTTDNIIVIQFVLYFEYNFNPLISRDRYEIFSYEKDIKPYVLYEINPIMDALSKNTFKELKLKEEELKSLYSILSYQKDMMEKYYISKIETMEGDNITYNEIDNLLEKVKNGLMKEED